MVQIFVRERVNQRRCTAHNTIFVRGRVNQRRCTCTTQCLSRKGLTKEDAPTQHNPCQRKSQPKQMHPHNTIFVRERVSQRRCTRTTQSLSGKGSTKGDAPVQHSFCQEKRRRLNQLRGSLDDAQFHSTLIIAAHQAQEEDVHTRGGGSENAGLDVVGPTQVAQRPIKPHCGPHTHVSDRIRGEPDGERHCVATSKKGYT